jgi:flagella basal body P-ring formation protein FlgA
VRLYKQVAVLRGTVRQGTILSPNDLDLMQKDAATLRGGFLTLEEAVGKPVRKTLSAGTVLLPAHLTAIKLVKRGQQIAIRALRPTFEVSMAGVALMDGEVGQRIRVRNTASQRVIEGLVTPDGAVSVSR